MSQFRFFRCRGTSVGGSFPAPCPGGLRRRRAGWGAAGRMGRRYDNNQLAFAHRELKDAQRQLKGNLITVPSGGLGGQRTQWDQLRFWLL